jgi:serine/threonine protein phosphatase PrpC
VTDTTPDGKGAPSAATGEGASPPIFEFVWHGTSDIGHVRDENEDNYVGLPEHHVFVVADGMGGHNAGRTASQLCVDAVADYFNGTVDPARYETADDPEDLSVAAREFSGALRAANERIFEAARDNRMYNGMGTTAVGIRFHADRASVAWAGDSRCYLYRNDQLAQLSVDHSLANFLRAIGRIQEADFAEEQMSNVIMRALGLEAEVLVDTLEFRVARGDRVLLCSDGLTDLVEDEEIGEMLANFSIEEASERLLQLALERGGRDNITILLVEVIRRIAPYPQRVDATAATDEVPAVREAFEDELNSQTIPLVDASGMAHEEFDRASLPDTDPAHPLALPNARESDDEP